MKMDFLTKAIYSFNTIPIKIATHFFVTDIERAILIFIRKIKKPSEVKWKLKGLLESLLCQMCFAGASI